MYYIPNYIEMTRGNAFPAAPFETQLFYRDDLNIWYIYDGTAWIDLQAPGMIVHGNAWHAPAFATEADLLAHIAVTVAPIHGSTVAAAINTLIHRDAAGRAQIANPIVNADIDNMGARDAAILVETLARALADAMHAAITTPPIHGSTVAANFNTLIHRDGAGRAQIVNPAVAADIDNLGARDAAIAAQADDYIDRASRLGFNPHIWAGTNGYQKSASNPILDANDGAAITGQPLAVIQAGIGLAQSVVRVHDNRYYMFLDIDIGAGIVQNRSTYLISSTTPDFAAYANHGIMIQTAPATYYSRLVYPASLIYYPWASGVGTDRRWKMLVGCWDGVNASASWAYADAITGPWTILGAAFESPTGFGQGAELIGRMIYYVRIDAAGPPWITRAYQGDIGQYTNLPSYTALGNINPPLLVNYARGFRFFSLMKHSDGLYLISYNENAAGAGAPTYGNTYLLAGGRFGQGALEVQACSPIHSHGVLVWEAARILSPWVILEGNDVFLYYSGCSMATFYQIGLATQSGNW